MLYLVRHGETAWNVAGLQTSFTDLSLTPRGCEQALSLKPYLADKNFTQIWCSPLMRARETCRLAGFGESAQIKAELTEWNAGDYEGLKTSEIYEKQPGWAMMTHGAPGGESVAQIKNRAQSVLKQILETRGDILIFSSSHFLRALSACFLGQEPNFGKHLPLRTGALSILDFENRTPVIKLWNLDVLSLCYSSAS